VSLTQELKQRLLPRKAAVVYIDCDLYLSTVPVLRFIEDFLQPGTVIVFDDWNCFLADPNRGERRAWREFRAASPELQFEPFVSKGMQASFIFTGRATDQG
jgi:predicted O-methyltransferase YrrM